MAKQRMPREMKKARERKRAPTLVPARKSAASKTASSGSGGLAPLHALLSQAWVAFVIEFDNEFERRMPHRTAKYGVVRGEGRDLRGEDLPDEELPYLVSMVMWERFLRHIDDDDEGVAAGELLRRVRMDREQLKNWLTRTGKWWGYVEIKRGRDPAADDAGGAAGGGTRVRLTRAGRMARKVWTPLARRIEKRWEKRFGLQQIDALRGSLAEINARLDARLPGTLPILGWGMFCGKARRKDAAAGAGGVENAEEKARRRPVCKGEA